jgi:hypothetical protein
MGYNGWEVYDTDGYYRGYFGARKEFSIPTIRNSRGYHDVEHEMSRCAETTRILLLGDSFVEAAQVGIEQTVSRQLERAVNAWSPTTPGRKAIECISLGRSGTGSVWQEQTLQREGLEYEPSIVVSEFLPSNDLRDNDFELELRVRWELGYRLNQSSLYRRLRDRRLQALGALLYRIDRLIADIRTGGFPQDRLVYHQPPLDPAWQRAWDRTEDAIIGMKALASGRGAAFVVVVFSTPYEIEAWRNPQQAAAKLAARAARRDLPADGWDFRYPARRVEALCRERGIPVLNLSRVFAELPDQQRGRLHLQSDGHWSPTGHRLAAAAIARFLNDQLQSSAE